MFVTLNSWGFCNFPGVCNSEVLTRRELTVQHSSFINRNNSNKKMKRMYSSRKENHIHHMEGRWKFLEEKGGGGGGGC